MTGVQTCALPISSMCPDMVETLASKKQTRAFIILSAGFGEETHEGALLEERILETVNKYGASLIGPNCIGLMNTWHHSVFSQPIPNLNPKGAVSYTHLGPQWMSFSLWDGAFRVFCES